MIYLVEDDESIRELVVYTLKSQGFEAKGFEKPSFFWKAMEKEKPDLILLDIMLPEEDGISILKKLRIRPDTRKLPVIMLTARGSEYDTVIGLDSGADDYITKPFNSREVVARIKAVLRRAGAQEKQEGRSRVEYDGLTIDMEEYQVVAFGQKMTFTAKEMELLWCLATNPGKAFSRNQLLETIWGYSYYGDTRTVDTHIKRIRQKLNIPENSKWDITTIWGVGYKFEVKSE